jgi:hypothetical protein
MQITAPGQGYQAFGDRLNSFGFGLSSFYPIVPE